MIEYFILKTYLKIALGWSMFAMVMQFIKYKDKKSMNYVLVFLFNFLICPIAIMIAIYKFRKNSKKKETPV